MNAMVERLAGTVRTFKGNPSQITRELLLELVHDMKGLSVPERQQVLRLAETGQPEAPAKYERRPDGRGLSPDAEALLKAFREANERPIVVNVTMPPAAEYDIVPVRDEDDRVVRMKRVPRGE